VATLERVENTIGPVEKHAGRVRRGINGRKPPGVQSHEPVPDRAGMDILMA
jgi:hypothetical protein